ncbi:MAG: phosphonate C-P lyase system protein PhnH, partial [bacterium]|nr:phosphonate C-P lyase system protein PhnH [bacterium]
MRTDPSPTSVLRSQATFRAVLDALSRPGMIAPLGDLVTPPAPLNPAAAAVLCALADQDTPVYLDRRLAGRDAVTAWLRFHTGAPMQTAPSEAVFALIADPETMPPLSHFRQGSDAYPDESATVILQVADFAGATPLELRGPGIARTARLSPDRVPEDLEAQLAANRAGYPCGVDLVFATPEAIAGLPRTTR